ncbi:bacterial type II/III secretion system protein [Rhodopirellula sallentina SM41]|uniref:Bacterial type II/III secretion system protein n=2 Tax=Rhodopirellula TaxID=265488 RepID=M5UHU0_9BACT|nr:bacterial type II/III secretion system protein [Rhodopirellula sallentina SM41]
MIAFVAMIVYGVVAVPALRPASAQSLASVQGDHKIANTVERMEMIVKSSRILSLGDRIPRFQVHNEEVLGATPVSENQIQIFAKNPGTTQVNLWDTEDKLYTIDVTIVADAREVEGILNSQLPLASLKVTPINESAIVSGFVTSVDDVERAISIIEQFYKVVINNIEVVGVQQVLLHTRIMEVSRTKLRQLGIDWSLAPGNFTLLNGPGELLDVPSGLVEGDSGILGFVPFGSATNLRLNINGDFEAFVEALDEQKLVKLLAEPTVVATHGRPARFIVGGRVPNVVPGNNGQLQVEYEDYGTSIDFLPFVIGPGRIRLEVRPEVSEPDPTRAVAVGSTNVAAFTTRYVETAVEMQAGETFAIAGLLQSRVESIVKRTPYLGHIPILGALFRNTQDQHNEIELLIMVTPELVDAMAPHEVPPGGPGLNSDLPDDCEFYWNGHIEVPNLKSDNCQQEGAACVPAEAAYQGGYPGGIQGGEVIMQGGYSKNGASKNGAGAATNNQQAAPTAAARQALAARQMPQQVTAPKSGFEGGNLIEPPAAQAAARVATAPRGSVPASYNQPANRSKFESGALLPAGAVTPTTQPKTVGQGVQVFTPNQP